MSAPTESRREGNLEAPTRHALDWHSEDFWNEDSLNKELERVYDICHGCRRCVSLCNSFPVLFDLVDESSTMEVDGVAKEDYWKVVDHCFLCDLCFMVKCPYVPPHEWNLDFPHLMLRAKAVRYKKEGASFRDKLLTKPDTMGQFFGIPIVAGVVNAANKSPAIRGMVESALGIHKDAELPEFHTGNAAKRDAARSKPQLEVKAGEKTTGKVAIFATCYGNHNEPGLIDDLTAVFEHNGIPTRAAGDTACCGMPRLELGDLESVNEAKEKNIPMLARLVDEGYDLTGIVPSCVLMFKQELPLMYPNDADVIKVKNAFYDPFEYLSQRKREGLMNTEFKNSLGKVAYHVACHQRVQAIGMRTREVLEMVPDTKVVPIERCSGHDGTYAVKKETHEIAMKLVKPLVNRVRKEEADHYGSDCPLAGHHVAHGLDDGSRDEHPLTLMRTAYGI